MPPRRRDDGSRWMATALGGPECAVGRVDGAAIGPDLSGRDRGRHARLRLGVGVWGTTGRVSDWTCGRLGRPRVSPAPWNGSGQPRTLIPVRPRSRASCETHPTRPANYFLLFYQAFRTKRSRRRFSLPSHSSLRGTLSNPRFLGMKIARVPFPRDIAPRRTRRSSCWRCPARRRGLGIFALPPKLALAGRAFLVLAVPHGRTMYPAGLRQRTQLLSTSTVCSLDSLESRTMRTFSQRSTPETRDTRTT